MRLLGLDKDCFSSWWAKLPEGSTMVVQPKIDGCAIGLRYKYGQLVDAYTRDDSEIIENIRNINSIPLSIDDSLKVEVELEGVLYTPFSNSKISIEQLLSNSFSKIDNSTSILFKASIQLLNEPCPGKTNLSPDLILFESEVTSIFTLS